MAAVNEERQRAFSAAKLKSLLEYDPETGGFKWRVAPCRLLRAGQTAGVKDHHGYININYQGARYRAHRLAWLYMTGEWPAALVDHIDNDGTNNRWSNLRAATKVENAQNTRKAMPGVNWKKDRQVWAATIMVDGRTYRGGRHKCLIDAVAARLRLERAHCTHSPRLGS